MFGCAHPPAPQGGHIVVVSHDTIQIRCNNSRDSWTLKCAASAKQWTGTTGNCSAGTVAFFLSLSDCRLHALSWKIRRTTHETWLTQDSASTNRMPFLRYSEILVENRRFEPSPPLFDLVGISPKFLVSENYRVPGLSYGVVCVIIRLAVFVQLRLVTDRRTYDDSIYRSRGKIFLNLLCVVHSGDGRN